MVVTSDHKPLEYIFNKPLYQALLLQKMLLTLQRLKIVYKPGTELFIADALSTNYLEEMKETLVPELEVNDVDLTGYLPISPEMYQDLLYWPGMAGQIEDEVSKCQVCSQYHKAQAKEPTITSKVHGRPWAKIGVDLFEI